MTAQHAVALNCTLKPSPAESSTDKMVAHVFDALSKHDVSVETVRVVDFDVKPGVEADMGDGDQWPEIVERIVSADILLVATPTWVGHMSSVAQRVLERLDAELSNTDDENRPRMVGKVGIAAVVGNEDGAHKIVADLFQSLNDIGFSIPRAGLDLLERRGDVGHRLQGSRRDPRSGALDHRIRRPQRRAPGDTVASAPVRALPGMNPPAGRTPTVSG